MFDRLQKPFLTVETGEAYQPIRLTYELPNMDEFIVLLNKIKCLEKNAHSTIWQWYWKEECEDLHFESIDSFRKNSQNTIRLGTLTLRDNKLLCSVPSFKRACMAVNFFHPFFMQKNIVVHHADFINKVFGLDERLPHGFTELFKDEELEKILQQRLHEYQTIQEKCETAPSAEQALNILSEYTQTEAKKRLPYAERYIFDFKTQKDLDVIFLSFYIYLRSRELVAIKRWFGETGYSLADAADETVDTVFGNMGIDIID